MIGSGFVVVDNFHSQILVYRNYFCFSVSFPSRKPALSQAQGFLCQTKVISYFVFKNHQFK